MSNETNAGRCCWEPSETGWGEEVRELLFVFRDVLSLTERGLAAPPSALQRNALPFPFICNCIFL